MKTWLFAAGLLAATPVFAQHDATIHAPADRPQTGYARMQSRAIKALSEQQIADLRAGKGLSFALPAELNHYPGPSHTLELAVPLQLSEEQKRKTQVLFEQMQAETKTLGEYVIASEGELDRLFRDRQATAASVQAAAEKTALAQGRLRAAHLRYHLDMSEILTPSQVARYDALRGYE